MFRGGGYYLRMIKEKNVKAEFHVPFMIIEERYGVSHNIFEVSDKSIRVRAR